MPAQTQPRFNFNQAGNQFADLLSGPAGLLLNLIPGAQGLLQSPTITNFLRRNTGAQLSDTLRRHVPSYQSPSTTGPMLRLPTSGPVGLSQIGEQAISERRSAFDALKEQGAAQRAATDEMRTGLKTGLGKLEGLQEGLTQAGKQAEGGFAQALGQTQRLRMDAMRFTQAGLATAANLMEEIRTSRDVIRKDFGMDVARRIEATAAGVRGSSEQSYNDHVRALESNGFVSEDERASLKSMYDRDANRQVALAAGSLHEASMEMRSQLEVSLQSVTSSAVTAIGAQVGETLRGGLNALAAADELNANLQTARASSLQNFAVAKAEVGQFIETLRADGNAAVFDMVTNTTYPVLVISDVMQGLFDIGWDIMSFHNNVQTQNLQNQIAVENPEAVALMGSLDATDSNRMFQDQQDTMRDASRNSLFGAGIGAAGSIGGGYLAGRTPSKAA